MAVTVRFMLSALITVTIMTSLAQGILVTDTACQTACVVVVGSWYAVFAATLALTDYSNVYDTCYAMCGPPPGCYEH